MDLYHGGGHVSRNGRATSSIQESRCKLQRRSLDVYRSSCTSCVCDRAYNYQGPMPGEEYQSQGQMGGMANPSLEIEWMEFR